MTVAAPGEARAQPLLRVVAGQPTAAEVAAVAVVVTAKLAARQARPAAEARRGGTGNWARRSGMLRAPLTRGPGAWRRSAGPA